MVERRVDLWNDLFRQIIKMNEWNIIAVCLPLKVMDNNSI